MKIVISKKCIFWVSLLAPFTIFVAIYPFILYLTVSWLLFMIITCGLDFLISHKLPHYLHMHLPEEIHIVQNKSKAVDLNLRNDTNHTLDILLVFDADIDLNIQPEEVRLLTDAKSESKISLNINANKRGEKNLTNICIEVKSSLGFLLIRHKKRIDCQIKVYPNIFQDNQRIAASLFLRSGFGMRSHRTIGHGREFEQLRDYLHDDNYSDIAWKATAKKGRPITKVFRTERTQQIFIVIDHSRTANFIYGNRPNLDIALETTLLMQLCTEREGDMLGMITFANKITGFYPPGKGKAHFGKIRNMLYDLHPIMVTPDFESLFIFIRRNIKKRSLILILTNMEDPGIANNLFEDIRIINHIHLITICTFDRFEKNLLFTGEPANKLMDIYKRLAAQQSYNEQIGLSLKLKKKNINMLRMAPSKFSIGVIDQYLTIKRRQEL